MKTYRTIRAHRCCSRCPRRCACRSATRWSGRRIRPGGSARHIMHPATTCRRKPLRRICCTRCRSCPVANGRGGRGSSTCSGPGAGGCGRGGAMPNAPRILRRSPILSQFMPGQSMLRLSAKTTRGRIRRIFTVAGSHPTCAARQREGRGPKGGTPAQNSPLRPCPRPRRTPIAPRGLPPI